MIEKVAYEYGKHILEGENCHHSLQPVMQRDRLGYDYIYNNHCNMVFEIKGMIEPHPISLPPSETQAIIDNNDNYILVCVFNITLTPNNINYRIIRNPSNIWQPINEALIPVERWLNTNEGC